jgi:proline iminopeptidase
MPYLEVGGCQHYYQWITGNNGIRTALPVLVFIHGWGGSSRYWQSTARSLTSQYDCLLYDLRGFGQSRIELGSTARYQLEDYADDLSELLERLQVGPVTLMAHSMGTSISTFFLNRYTAQVDRVILACGGVFKYDQRAFAAFARFGRIVVKLRPAWLGNLPGVDRLFMQRFLYQPLPRAESRAFLQDFLVADQAAALGTMLASVSRQAAEVLPQQYADLAQPTLLIAGEHDRIIPPQLGQKAAALNPRIEFVTIPQSGHFPMLENPRHYLETVRAFLARAPAGGSSRES